MAPGNKIRLHHHPHAEEILFVHRGTGVVRLGSREATVRAGATVDIPRNVSVGLLNTGDERLSLVFIFSEPDGMSGQMRSCSVGEGEPLVPFTPEELAARNARAVITSFSKSRLTRSDEWTAFESSVAMHQILGGMGNISKYTELVSGKPYEGVALRLFNAKTRLWSIYWADSNSGALDPPVVGSFANKLGHFFARDTYKGQDIIVVFQWDARNPATDLESGLLNG